MFDHGTSRRTALKIVGGTSLAALSSRFGHAQTALQPIQMGIQIFTGAVATVWVNNKIPEKRGLSVEGKQMADGRSVRDAMISGQLNAGTMNITPFIVGAGAASLTMVGVVSLGGDTVGVMAKKGAGINSIADLKGKKISVSTGSTTGNTTTGYSNITVQSTTVVSNSSYPFRIVDFYSAYAPGGGAFGPAMARTS